EKIDGFIANARSRSLTILLLNEWNLGADDVETHLYGPWNPWAEIIRRVHCGADRHYFSLLQEAVNQGYMQENKTIFMLLDLYDGITHGTGYERLAPYTYGTLVIRPAQQKQDEETDPHPQFMREVLESTNTTFKTLGPRAVTLESANVAGCVRVLIPTITELVRRGYCTWEEIAQGDLLNKMKKSEILSVAN
ncbi:hypothetical protein HK102_006325, partial [Quaeritorhiza haematococci]